MPAYRLYFLGPDDRIKRAQVIDAADDDEARATAAELDHAFKVELWEAARKIDIITLEGR